MQNVSDVVESVLRQARQQGMEQAEAAVNYDQGFTVTARMGSVETIERHQQRSLHVTVYKDRCKGSASTNDLKPEAIARTVDAAVKIAAYTSSDPCAGLAPAELLAEEVPDLQLQHIWEISPEEGIELAIRCENEARDHVLIANSEGASVTTVNSTFAYGNTHGFVGAYDSSHHSVSCSVVARNDSGMQRDYWYTTARVPSDLESAESVGRKARERSIRRLNARQAKTGRVPVLFEPSLARGLIGHFFSAISGSALYRNASFMKGKLGETIFPDWLTVKELPHLPKALGSAPFDHDGVALKDRTIVEEGVLQAYVLSQYSACRLGLQTTGNAGGVHNIDMTHSGSPPNELIAQMGTGLMVTELIGHGVNTVTGDYSRGAAGFWIENGEIQYPVEEITIAGNLSDMFQNIVAIGNDTDLRGKIRCGSVLVSDMMVAGN